MHCTTTIGWPLLSASHGGREVRTSRSGPVCFGVYLFRDLKFDCRNFLVWKPRKNSWRAAERPVGVDGAARARAGHLVPQGPLERRPCSPSTNCTAPGPRTAARADRRTGERAGERGPGASWALGAGARARNQNNNIIILVPYIYSRAHTEPNYYYY